MPSLGIKHNGLMTTLGTKAKRLAYGLGTRLMPPQISNIIAPVKTALELGSMISNLIPNKSNSADLQYMPTGVQNTLEKKGKRR
jgi:hypothetical protein